MADPATRKSSWVPALLYPGLLCIAVVLGFVYYYEQTGVQNQALLNDRAFRILSAFSERLKTRIGSFDTVLRQSSRLPADQVEKYFENQVTDLAFGGANCGATTSLDVLPPPANAPTQTAILQFARARTGSPVICGKVSADDLVNRFLSDAADFFDQVLVTKADGTVLFQTANAAARIADVAALFPDSKTASQDDTGGLGQTVRNLYNKVKGSPDDTRKPAGTTSAPGKFLTAIEVSGLNNVQIGGAEYRLYTSPILVPVENFETHAVTQQLFAVCGLYGSGRFQAVSKTVPPVQALAGVLLILFALAVAWPFFRFPFMGITERIPRRAGLYYGLSMLGAAGLLVLLSLHVRYYAQGTETDAKLQRLATTLETNVAGEVRNALQVLDALSDSAPFTVDNTRLAKSETCASHPEFVSETVPHTLTDLLARPAMPIAQYPYFDNVFWSDAQGFQRAKWSVHTEITPPVRLCSFGFFQNTLAGRLWYFGDDGPGGPRFRIDPLYSPNTAEYLATISQVASRWEHTPTGIRMAHMVTPLLTLIAPVLPPGYGFAIIDPAGQVLFHSDPAKNSSENFFAECDESSALRRASASRLVKSLNTDYLGRPHRMLVSPFQRFQNSQWTLVVFADRATQSALHWSRMFLCTVIALVYFLALAAAGLLLITFGQYPPSTLAPVASRTAAYQQIAAVLMIASVLFWNLIFVEQERFVLYAAVIIPFLTMIFVGLKLNLRESVIAPAALILLLICVTGLVFLKTRPDSRALRQTWVVAAELPLAFSLLALRWRVMPRFRWLNNPVNSYAAAAACLVVTVAILPCVAFFRLANDFEQDLFTRREQILVTDQVRALANRTAAQYDDSKVRFAPESEGDSLKRLARWRFLRRRLSDSRYRLDSAFSGWETGRLVSWNQTGIPDHLAPELILLAQRIPLQSQSPASADYLAQNVSSDASSLAAAPALPEWVWYREGSNQVRLDKNHALDRRHPGHAVGGSSKPGAQDADPPDVADIQRLAEGGTTLVDENRVSDVSVLSTISLRELVPVVALVLLGVFVSVRWTIRRLFVLHLKTDLAWTPMEFGPDWTFPEKLILLGSPWGEKASLIPKNDDTHILDLADLLRTGKPCPKIKQPNVVLDHFAHGMENPEFNRIRLELLEKLIFRLKKRVIIVSSVDPCFYFTHDDEEAPPLPAAQISDETNRWAKVLYGFETRWIDSHPKLDQNYYRVLWSTCTRLERAALFQLATEGWANYKNRHALQHLYERRLVTWQADDPVARIASADFRDFIAKSISMQDREAWIESDREGRWLALRHLVVVVLIALAAAAFYVAQQQTLALLASASTLVPSAWKFISDVRGGKPGGAKNGAAA